MRARSVVQQPTKCDSLISGIALGLVGMLSAKDARMRSDCPALAAGVAIGAIMKRWLVDAAAGDESPKVKFRNPQPSKDSGELEPEPDPV